MNELLLYMTFISGVFSAVIVIALTIATHKSINEKITRIFSVLDKLDEKHDDHEKRITQLENDLHNILQFGCERREGCKARGE